MHRAVLAVPFVVAALCVGAAAGAQSLGVSSEGTRSLVWSNGDSFTGEFRGGLPNGPGVFRSADGEEQRGEWRDGCLVNERTRIAVLTRLSDCPSPPPPSRPQRPKQLPHVDFFR
jgi:hypothetical protein